MTLAEWELTSDGFIIAALPENVIIDTSYVLESAEKKKEWTKEGSYNSAGHWQLRPPHAEASTLPRWF